MVRGLPPTLPAVGPLETIATVADRERAIGARDDVDRITCAVFRGKVGNKGFGDVVILAAFIREVKLPEVLQTRRFLYSCPGFDRAAFNRAVIHNGDARVEGVDDRQVSGGRCAVVGR